MSVTNLTQRLCRYWGKLLLIQVLLLSQALPNYAQVPCAPTAEFSYSATTFCQNGLDPTPLHTTGANGTYSYNVVSGGPILSINATTGVIDLSASFPGVYNVTNTQPGPLTCVFTVTILATPDPEFFYDKALYCPFGPNPVLGHTTGSNGLYSFGPIAGGPTLDLNPATGAINLATSNLGTYIVTNTISGVCPTVSATFTLVIGDTIAPTITCPSSIIRNLDAGECDIIVHFPLVTAIDDCDPNLDIAQIGGLPTGSSFSVGTNTITMQAVDSLQNASTCSFDIVVVEYPNPIGSMNCNNLVQLTLTPNGVAIVNADQILEGGPYGCYNDYIVTITNDTGLVLGNILTCDAVGDYLTAKVMNPDNGNSCWGRIDLEDKNAPVVLCQDWTIPCTLAVNNVAAPDVSDNCDFDPELTLSGISPLDVDACDDNLVRFLRTWVATDFYGNTSAPCTEIITVERPLVVDFPTDIIWQCHQYAARPAIVNATPLRSNIIDTDLTTEAINVSPTLADLNGTGSGVPSNIVGEYCKYNVSYSDEIIYHCGASVTGTFEIIRTWVVLDWCTGTIIVTGVGGEDNVQVIKVMDTMPPIITASNLTVNANVPGIHPHPCRSTDLFPMPIVIDSCSGVASIVINTQVGEVVNGHIPAPGLPIGLHIVTIQAFDYCGNVATKDVVLTVTDGIAPTPVCVEYTEVNLETTGTAEVFADAFNQASTDNCCIDHYEVRRMDFDPCDDGHNDLLFGPSVFFCCEDAGETITVVFRAYDCFGNYNDCMVQVFVNDKLIPVLVSCPSNQRITCDWYADNLETQVAALQTPAEKSEYLDQVFGIPTFYDNCDFTLNRNFSSSIDQCLEGTITRSFTATDGSGNISVQPCTQTINVDHVSDWVVEFPADVSINCGATPPSFGEPEVFYETCELVAITYDDELLNVVPDACYKIVRTWVLINWCVVGAEIDQEVVEQPENQLGVAFPQCDLDSDGDCDARTFRDSWRGSAPVPNPFAPAAYRLRPSVNDAHTPNNNPILNFRNPDTDGDTDPWDGYITYQQTIKVLDSVDPVFVNGCAIPKVCIDDNTCAVDLLLPTPEISDCSPNVTITAQVNIGGVWLTGFGSHLDVAPGTYQVVYTAMDNCNNQSVCNTTVMVKDCKKPTPYCKTGIIVTLMNSVPPVILVWASDLDDNSFDNCDTLLTYSFSADTTKTYIGFDCTDQNTTTFVDVWVTDDCGNQDFCSTFITVQDNAQGCPDPLISFTGLITNEDDQGIENVEIHLNGSSSSMVQTAESGVYEFSGLLPGGDYSAVPLLDDAPRNGVSTFDLVLISKHVLDIQPLDSPYKIIAADANKSGSVTTFDMVEIRKLILYINDDFPNNTSWRFVDKNFVFPNPSNPWQTQFPEVFNINDISINQSSADFIGIKVGDVNGSAAASNLNDNNEERSGANDFILHINDKLVEKGEVVVVPFSAETVDLAGFQFTLDFDQEKLEFQEIHEGLVSKENFGFAKLDKGAITASWSRLDGSSSHIEGQVFSMAFKAKEAGYLHNMLSIGSRFTEAEAYLASLEKVGIELSLERIEGPSRTVLFQNTPNPFSDQTTISFSLPAPTDCSLTFTDVSGKVLKTMKGHFPIGYSKVVLKRNELDAGGIIYYRLETLDFTETRMMVLMN